MPLSVKAMYWLPHCSTCQKAEAFLKQLGVQIDTVIDVKTQTIQADQLNDLIQGIGSVEALFSKRAMKYRSLGLHEQVLSDDDMKQWMLDEYTFIKRPALLLSDGTTLAGFSEKQYKARFTKG